MSELEIGKMIEDLVAGGISQSQIAKNIGVSASALTQIKKGTYNADTATIVAKLKSFSDKIKTKTTDVKIGRHLPFVETSVSKSMWSVIYQASVYSEFAIIYSEAGYGKTTAIKEYIKKFSDTIFIEADSDYTSKVLFTEISRVLGGEGRGTLHTVKEDVINRLKDTNRLIIIDEAEHLRSETLNLLRRVYDKTDIGLVLVGMEELKHNIEGQRGIFKQLWSRVDASRKLPTISEDDIKKIVGVNVPNASNSIIKTFIKECNKNTRVLSKLIKTSVNVAKANSVEITEKLIKQAGSKLMYKGL